MSVLVRDQDNNSQEQRSMKFLTVRRITDVQSPLKPPPYQYNGVRWTVMPILDEEVLVGTVSKYEDFANKKQFFLV